MRSTSGSDGSDGAAAGRQPNECASGAASDRGAARYHYLTLEGVSDGQIRMKALLIKELLGFPVGEKAA